MARFASVAELETFLGRLDPNYSQFASALWQKSVRTVLSTCKRSRVNLAVLWSARAVH